MTLQDKTVIERIADALEKAGEGRFVTVGVPDLVTLLALARAPVEDEGVVRGVRKLIEAARMYEASCRLGGKDQAFASHNLDKAKAAALAAMRSTPVDEAQIKRMAERFLMWPVPDDFHPDNGVTYEGPLMNKGTKYEMRRHIVGTNLLNAEQAEAMVRFIVKPTPEGEE